MSTRANIVVKDEYKARLWFYRHSDGYPGGTLNILGKFMQAVVDGKLRDNLSQSAGYLIQLGHDELVSYNLPDGYLGWKVGTIEPTTGQHGDIEFLYILDISKKTIEARVIPYGFDTKHSRGKWIARIQFLRDESPQVTYKNPQSPAFKVEVFQD